MSYTMFMARWSRIFADAGLQVSGSDLLETSQARNVGPNVTQAAVGYHHTDPNLRGTRWFSVDSLQLGPLFKNIESVDVFPYMPHSHRDIAVALIERYALPLDPDWFVDTPIPDEQLLAMPFTVDLQLTGGVWRWASGLDKLTVTVHEPQVNIASAFAVKVLPVPVLPYTTVVGKTNIELVSVSVDFTPLYVEDYDRLLSITKSADLYESTVPEVYTADVLIRLLEERTGITTTRLTTVDTTQLSVNGAVFVYNGKTTGYVTADTSYDRVLVFSVNCPGYTGKLYFHYNDLY